jgi:predicted Ser/Thr protein kinase
MDPLQPGDPVSVGSYRLLGRLGAGGMGQVFLGVSPGGRKVAVKVIHPLHAGSAQFRERFAREIEAAQRVGGFHTAPVVDADPHADPPWMVTAFIDGPSLQDAVDGRGPLSPGEVRALGAGLAEGLAAIHARGLVHRDLKPGNVILAPDGPRIIDFGIARVIDASTGITNAGAVVGTFAYMSPEHLGGDAIRPASDVFSLGSVLAFAATGWPPFGADTAAAVMYRLVSQPPDLTGLADAKLAGLIGECLAKAPEVRPTVSYLLAAFGDPGPEPLLAGVPGDVAHYAATGGVPGDVAHYAAAGGAHMTTPPQPVPETGPERVPVTSPPQPPLETGPEREVLPWYPLPPAASTRPRRWPAALISAVVLVAALAIALPLLLSTSAPPAVGSHRSDAAATMGAGVGGPAPTPDPARPSPTASKHRRTPPATASGAIAATSPAGEPTSTSPASSGNPKSSKTPAGSKSPQLVDVPDVIGLTANQAIQELKNAGFMVVVLPRNSGGTFNPGRVVQYSPVGQAPRGSTIDIVL